MKGDLSKKSARGGRREGAGRPVSGKLGLPASTWLYASEYDRLQALAERNNLSISQAIRRLIILRLT